MVQMNKFTVLETVFMFVAVGISFNKDDWCDVWFQRASKMRQSPVVIPCNPKCICEKYHCPSFVLFLQARIVKNRVGIVTNR
jgi:hypothetical protein